jgi:toxin ParE1/3/4
VKVVISTKAERDLERIGNYLARETDNPEIVDRVYSGLAHVLELIGENPLMGREWLELSAGLRGFPHGDYMVFWRIRKDSVQIVRVMHQKQDIARAFRPRGSGAD